jgi:hypothetical protein
MLLKMSRKPFAYIFGALFLFLSAPSASATDIPTLTWERGKVQNIVVGNASQQANWKIMLLSERVSDVTFSPSEVNKRGFIVYSVGLKPSLPLGQYSVVVFGNGNAGGTEIALVQVIELKSFSILNSKNEVGILGVLLSFILVLLSTLKAKKYSSIRFFREDKLIEDGSLLYARSIPRFAYKFYLNRIHSLDSFRPSLMKFLMQFDDTFLHKLSPLAWVLLPTIGLITGIYGGFTTAQETLKFPILSLALLTVISVIDAYCAIFVISGFIMAQITLGEVMNFRTVIEIATLGLTLVGTALISSHLHLVLQREVSDEKGSRTALPKTIYRMALCSLITAAFFLVAFLLAQSLSNDEVMARGELITVASVAGLVSAIKYYLHAAQDIKIFGSERMESLKEVHHNVEQIISPFWNILIILSSFFGAFVWTENWAIALIFGLLNAIYFGLLLLQLPTHNFQYILKWERSIVFEPLVFALVSIGIYFYFDRLPLQASDRSILFIIGVYLISIVHSFMSQLSEITEKPRVSQR